MSATEAYFDDEVVPEFRTFLAASAALVRAVDSGDEAAREDARKAAMRAGKNAVLAVHHMLDRVATDKPAWLPADKRDPAKVRTWMQDTYGPQFRIASLNDFHLLGDVADAFKHFSLRDQTRPVASRNATVVMQTGYGQLGFGEGNFGGRDQVVVTQQDGRQRALSALLQNCIDGWRLALGRPLLPFNE